MADPDIAPTTLAEYKEREAAMQELEDANRAAAQKMEAARQELAEAHRKAEAKFGGLGAGTPMGFSTAAETEEAAPEEEPKASSRKAKKGE